MKRNRNICCTQTHTHIHNTNAEKLTHAHTAVCTFAHRNTLGLTEREGACSAEKETILPDKDLLLKTTKRERERVQLKQK